MLRWWRTIFVWTLAPLALPACNEPQECSNVLLPTSLPEYVSVADVRALVNDDGSFSDAACRWLCVPYGPTNDVECRLLTDVSDLGGVDSGGDTGEDMLIECTLWNYPACI